MRVGDAERWAVDARLQQAVGDGVLTLPEYAGTQIASEQDATAVFDGGVYQVPAAPRDVQVMTPVGSVTVGVPEGRRAPR